MRASCAAEGGPGGPRPGRLAPSAIGVLCALILLGTALPADAQGRRGDPDPWTLPSETLREQGWEFSEEQGLPGSIVAGLMATTIGLPVRGIGHTMIGDRPTAWRLAGAQAAGLVLHGSGLLLRHSASPSVATSEAATALQVAGASLFFSSWAADVLGAFRGTGLPAEHEGEPDAILTLELWYTRLFAQGLSSSDILILRAPMRFGQLLVVPEAQLASSLRYRRIGAELGWAFGLGAHASSELHLLAVGRDETLSRDDGGRTSFGADLELHAALGDIFPHLRGLTWIHRIGARADFPYLGGEERRRLQSDNLQWRIPTGFALALVAGPALRLETGYSASSDALVGRLGRHVGVLHGRVTVLPARRLGVEIKAEQGEFFRLGLGLRWYLGGAGGSNARGAGP